MHPTPHLQQVFKDDLISIQIDKDLSLLYVEWFKHPQSSEFREVYQRLADIILGSQVKYWLSDARAIHYLELGDQNWIIKEMAPLLKQSKLLKFARLITKEGMEMMDVVRLYDQLEHNPELVVKTKFELFNNSEDALEWLLADE
ncbi:hypothetical protein TH61_17110 [Rufibacter sp. DG15C]|uniref:hypothetical protein n=1 Tax=Rufibacter sp. DG15C TaxID=1379909 RepID=UPI00078D9533|nr:hypothetical protein [Rufibacter sp. DG15C]AMM52558.1 hypothetical protein TH61_17110 [Rufibacter sp. DG15C]